MHRIPTVLAAAAVLLGAAACSSSSHTASAPTTATTSAPATSATAAPSPSASATGPVGAAVLYGEDQAKHATANLALSDYQGLWSKLGDLCTDDPATIQQAIERVYRVQKEPTRYEAMRYMIALQSGPPGSCAGFDSAAG